MLAQRGKVRKKCEQVRREKAPLFFRASVSRCATTNGLEDAIVRENQFLARDLSFRPTRRNINSRGGGGNLMNMLYDTSTSVSTDNFFKALFFLRLNVK